MLKELRKIPEVRKALIEGKVTLSELGSEGDWNSNTISLLLGLDIVEPRLNNFALYTLLRLNGYIKKDDDTECLGCSA